MLLKFEWKCQGGAPVFLSIQLLVFPHTPCCCWMSDQPRLYFEEDICECQWLFGILSKPESI